MLSEVDNYVTNTSRNSFNVQIELWFYIFKFDQKPIGLHKWKSMKHSRNKSVTRKRWKTKKTKKIHQKRILLYLYLSTYAPFSFITKMDHCRGKVVSTEQSKKQKTHQCGGHRSLSPLFFFFWPGAYRMCRSFWYKLYGLWCWGEGRGYILLLSLVTRKYFGKNTLQIQTTSWNDIIHGP